MEKTMKRKPFLPAVTLLLLWLAATSVAPAQKTFPPFDLWSDQVMSQIRDRATLEYTLEAKSGYSEVYFTSNTAASYFDAQAPYAEHNNETIRIHGYLVYPAYSGTNYPAVVVAHGRNSQADLGFAQMLSSMGLIVLAIDGPRAGKSTGGPEDKMQAWISVDKGAQYSYLYHYAYAAMRAVTLLETLTDLSGNPYKIDINKVGGFGVSSGGMVISYMNGVDSRLKAAIVAASAGNWPSSMHIANSWLYHDIFTGTRDLPYNGNDPLNSIEDVDVDPTAITFQNYFDPIRYAVRQYAPVLTLMGTHDQYVPLPAANLTQLAYTSSGINSLFDKRLWLMPNMGHEVVTNATLLKVTGAIDQWLDYCFNLRAKALVTPTIAMTELPEGLRFDITLTGETASRLSGASMQFHAATRIDSTSPILSDFTPYTAFSDGTRYVTNIVAGEKSSSGDVYTAQNIIYFVTINDALSLPVSSPVYKGKAVINLSTTGFNPVLDHSPNSQTTVPAPAVKADAAKSISSSLALTTVYQYQGFALANPTDKTLVARVEARETNGSLSAAENLANPVYISVSPRSERIFLAEEWMGVGVRKFGGSFLIGYSDVRSPSLTFRGSAYYPQLDANGPLTIHAKKLWLPTVPDFNASTTRKLRFFSTASTASVANLTYRKWNGDILQTGQVIVPAMGSAELEVTVGSASTGISLAQIEATVPVAARMEVRPTYDTWSIEALPAPTATTFVQPHAEWNGTYRTVFVITNTSQTATRIIKFKRYTTTGTQLGNEVPVTIEPNITGSLMLETLFSVATKDTPGAGWVKAELDGGDILMHALAYDSRTGATAVSPIASGSGGSLSMPFFVANAGYWTGLALSNTGSSAATVNLSAYGETGELVGHADVTLGVNCSTTQLINQWLADLPRETTGQLVISTTSPLALLAYFGTNDGYSLAAIPFTPFTP